MAYEANLGLIALTRFGYGPRGDGDTAIAAGDPRGMLRAELNQPGIALLSGPDLPTTPAVFQRIFAEREQRKAERAAPPPAATAEAAQGPAMQASSMQAQIPATMQDAKRPPPPGLRIFREEALARFRRGIEARVGFAERLVAFWSNHFCISAAKGGIGHATAGAFEREAIRPHVLGRFADMLLAVESHPAMLFYLDNARSVGPASSTGLKGGRGLNENLGREIIELHTLGVDSGYGQADVTALAGMITGWTFVGPKGKLGEPGSFVFDPAAHQPGSANLLGKRYGQDGAAQGAAALLDLARHPATATHIAAKFARAFVADDPPPALVARLARTFCDTDGDLKALAAALVDAPESWVRTPSRMRTPHEFVVGAHRLLRLPLEEPGPLLGPLRDMGMALWQPPGPNGFSTDAASWASPEGMKLRLDYAAAFARRLKDPPNPSDLLDALCGGRPSPETRAAVARAESRAQGLALLLMSPEMQRS